MSASTPLTDRIIDLTTAANLKTGASDTTLTDAVGRLIDGYNDELYSIGTDVITAYIGRQLSDGRPNWITGESNVTTGAYGENPDASTQYSISMNFVPVQAGYVFLKQGNGFIYHIHFYDSNYQWLGAEGISGNWNKWTEFSNIPSQARYMRFAAHSSDSYNKAAFFRIA